DLNHRAPGAGIASPGERTPLACWFRRFAETIFKKVVAAECGDQHAASVRFPELRLKIFPRTTMTNMYACLARTVDFVDVRGAGACRVRLRRQSGRTFRQTCTGVRT